MSTLPSFDRLLGAMSGTNSTSDWDVLVSYSVTKLNAILPSLWQGDTFNDVLFNRDYLDFGLRTAAHLSIGAPTLQFVAGENAKALLTMKLQGWLRTDTLNVNPDTGEIISVVEGGGNTKVNIAPGRYQLQAAVPLVNMTGDASIQEAGQTVVLDDKTPGSRIVFHFKSQNSVYNVALAPGITDKRKEDTKMSDLGPRIAAYFQGLNSLDYAIASVQQTKNGGDSSRVLTPESFIFTTQGSSPGVLCVYIKTRGSGNNSGWSAPHFQPNNNDVLPIPQGFTASIIIRHDLFSDKYLIPQLQNQVTGAGLLHQLDKDDSFTNGFRYMLQMNPAALKNDKYGPGPWRNLDLYCDYQFTQPPLALTLSNRSANWNWEFQDYRYPWSHSNNNLHGKVYFDVHLNANYPIASVTDDHIALHVDLHREDFHLWIHPYNGTILEKWGAGWTDTLPDVLSQMCYFDINDLRLGSGDFDFFATQNVFAPGRHIIKVDSSQGMAAPHDVLMVGDIVDPAALVSLPTPLASIDSADGGDTNPAPGPQPLARLKMLLLNDQDFVQKTFAALRDGKSQDFEKAVSDKQLTVSDSDLQTLREQASASPSFDIRLAAGLYKIDSPASMSAVNMTISPLDGMISFDNVHVENQTTDTDTGMVNWTTNQGANVFQASWTSEFDSSGNVSLSFKGQTWLASQPTDKASFTGSQVTSGPGNWFASTTSQGISFVLSCVGMTALVLAAIILGVQELRKKGQDPAPAIEPARRRAVEAASRAQRQAEDDLSENPLRSPSSSDSSILEQRGRNAARREASQVAIGEGDSALFMVRQSLNDAVDLSARSMASTELVQRLGFAMAVLPNSGADLVEARADVLARTAMPLEYRDALAQATLRSAQAARAAQESNANLASAVRAFEEKQGVTTQLKGERDSLADELMKVEQRIKAGGTDPADLRDQGRLGEEIRQKEAAIEQAERDEQQAEARRSDLQQEAKENEDTANEAEKAVEDLKPEPQPEMP